jgi:pyruvate/2-oxoglutarate dehydrogenase complex dihydrolipoamide dehydrogenase (E3) component
VIQNSLFFGRKKLSALTTPWCTYTDPEIAQVGMYERDTADRGIRVDTVVRHLKDVDRAIADGEAEGFVKVHVAKGRDRVLGATIVAPLADEMIGEVTLAIVEKIGLKRISGVIHPYPTQAEAIKQVADLYNRPRLKTGAKRWFERWMAWRRKPRCANLTLA